DHALTVRRKPRREAHARKVADDFALAGFDIVQKDAWITLAVGHVGDLLCRWREPRGEDQVVAASEIAHVGAILIHDGKPLDPPLPRAGLVDEHDAPVEVPPLPRDPLVHPL